jgi:serine protease Do
LLVGSDAATDLAVLKIDAQGLTPAEFGDSDQMEVGDVVVAIGNPMGEELRGTMTDGILSAINRDMEVEGRQMTLLQTTAALNTGNSGGALINDMGQVIGITNMKLMAYNSTVEGLGFAIPSRTAKTVVDDLIGYGVLKGRPMLGSPVRPLTAEERTGRSLDHGLWVAQVEEKSDAWTQGIRTGDVLLSANGVELSVNDDLLELKNALAVGETIQFCLWREGETLDITVELVEQYSLE